jgi:predicted dehydrogenase
LRGAQPAKKDSIGYALIGAGAFGTHMLVPQMDRRPDRFQLRAVVSRDAVRGSNFARSRRIATLASHPAEVLGDPNIDLVVIATRHSDHPMQVEAALAAGKAVFVEKPLAIDWAGLERVRAALEKVGPGNTRLMVGFNRRFAPAVARLKDVVAGRRSPLVISYRLNGGFIPSDHWIQGAAGGGRNVGEACHMYDLFRSLAGAPLSDIQALAINPGTTPHLRNDNFVATLRYEDGSVGNLVYTALGPKEGLSKERIEVFADGEAYVIDDFKSLIRSSTGEVLWQSRAPEKGHFEELNLFGEALASGGEQPIPLAEILETTAASLQIEDLIHGRA